MAVPAVLLTTASLTSGRAWNFTVTFLNVWNAFRPSETDYTPFAPTPEQLPETSDGLVQPYADSPLDEENVAERERCFRLP